MLKLEKTSRTHDIMVSLRDRDSRFNRTFLTAFAIAAGLHLAAGVLFSIRPFLLGSSELILPPVAASADLTAMQEEKDNIAVAQLDKGDRLPRTILEPPYSKPIIPEIPPSAVSRKREYVMKTEPAALSFALLEEEFFTPDFLANAPTKEYIPLTISISGQLASRGLETMHDDSLAPLTKPVPCHGANPRQFRAQYAVEVENRSGRVFWYEPQNEIEDPACKQLAENVLQKLRFHPSDQSFVTPGEVEIVFNMSRS